MSVGARYKHKDCERAQKVLIEGRGVHLSWRNMFGTHCKEDNCPGDMVHFLLVFLSQGCVVSLTLVLLCMLPFHFHFCMGALGIKGLPITYYVGRFSYLPSSKWPENWTVQVRNTQCVFTDMI